MESITLALDWFPNTHHSGFYVAQSKGWYKERGLEVSFCSPHEDGYTTTPASKVASGIAQFALTPSESVISHFTMPKKVDKPKTKGIAAVLSKSTSAIVTKKSSGIDRPAKLDGKNYASYGARYEGRIIQQMIKHDGGKGDYNEQALPPLGLWNDMLDQKHDAAWVFMGWEGVEAERRGIELNVFKLEDYGVPYGYSPLLMTTEDVLEKQPEMIRKFLAASAEGYKFAAENPEEAARLFFDAVEEQTADQPLPTPLDLDMVIESQKYISKYLLDDQGRWGVMEAKVWDDFLDWLSNNGLLTSKLQSRKPDGKDSTSLDGLRQGDVGESIPRESVASAALFTNEFLPQ